MINMLHRACTPRTRTTLAACLLLAAFALVVRAQSAPTTAPADAKTPGALKLHLMDGSVVSGKISIPQIEVETKFGTLKIPLDQVRSFTPGLDSHPDLDKKIAAHVADLGADGFAEREKAQQELQKMGPEIRGELERYLKTSEAERQTRLQKLVEEFDSQRESDDEANTNEWVREDIVVTNSFTVVGRIRTVSFDVASPYGSLTAKLSDIRRVVRESRELEEVRKNVVVSGNLIPTRSFEITTIRVTKGDQIFVNAAGNIMMSPWGGNLSSTPDGGPNFGFFQPGNIAGGSLIMKIGNDGTPIKVGSKRTIVAPQSGVLQFGIAVAGDYSSYTFPGEYNVKLRIVRK